ncbi:hypothetical protein BGW36DRAFT_382668 [Talaromyces proteolyticus]|uniref:Uncharacterized protein n=1 Tax=Talaromyces proteolyticus TaxID=1131652 RepID=A0AAD4KNG5_9EURO|nr:uncharacterized protein BGW36DRAFT_382668 [Talaromyces proteolyticus]KAH8695424.1 hypothetical protein BGW36DRAFT_382668 [Talaromyces proteolyticus]
MVQIDWEAQRAVGHARSLWRRTVHLAAKLPSPRSLSLPSRASLRSSLPSRASLQSSLRSLRSLQPLQSLRRLRASRPLSHLVGVFFLLLCLLSYSFARHRSFNIFKGSSLVIQDAGLPDDFNFHILLSAQPKNVHLCRTITSAMILDYPPMTLLKQNPEPRRSSKKSPDYDGVMIEKVESILLFLKTNGRVFEHDLVLVVDNDDILFQLPPEILIKRYRDLYRRNNDRLKRKYGTRYIGEGDNRQLVQKYTQKVLFAARKDCSLNVTDSVACASVPQSPLPPDIYGPKTDKKRDGTKNRPRWIDAGVVMGQVSNLIPLYERVLEDMKKQPIHSTDQTVLTQMYGNQEYSREVARRRSISRLKEWVGDSVGISDASNITNVRSRIQPGDWHEFGISLDYEGQLFLNTRKATADIEWLKYRDVRKVSSVQIQHGVPREVRLNLPLDIEQSASNPFKQTKPGTGEVVRPAFNTSIDVLPPAWNFTWNDVPLATYIQTAAVPAIVHTNDDLALRQDYWNTAWFHPWARALLRNHVRSSIVQPHTHPALGASEVLKNPGRKGGMWLANDGWMSFKDLCSGHEEAVFGDGLGAWGEEKPNKRPIYNLWGKLMAGKGPKYVKLGESKSEAEEIEKYLLGIEDEDDE